MSRFNLFHPALFLTLATLSPLGQAQCSTDDQAKASLAAVKTEMDESRAINDSAMTALLAQVDANGAKLKWDGKRRAAFVEKMMTSPVFVRAQEDKKAQTKKVEAVQEELGRLKADPGVKGLCTIVVKYREPLRAIARLNDEQIADLNASVKAMK